MSTLDDLIEIDDISKFKTYIKTFILQNEDLYRLIYFSNSNPLSESCIYPENPYTIFEESSDTNNPHGVVLFDRKNDSILNYEVVNLLIDFESTSKSNSKEFNQLYIIFRVIIKGSSIRTLQNGLSRSFTISKLINNEFDSARINGLGETRQISFEALSLNEENVGYTIIYRATSFSRNPIQTKNYKKHLHGNW